MGVEKFELTQYRIRISPKPRHPRYHIAQCPKEKIPTPGAPCSSMPTIRCGKTTSISNAPSRISSFLNHHEYSPEQVREVLNQVETGIHRAHGYGLHSFAHSLVQTFERWRLNPSLRAHHETIHGFAHTIADHPVEILAGVTETLQYLSAASPDSGHQRRLREQTGKVRTLGTEGIFCRGRDRLREGPEYLS